MELVPAVDNSLSVNQREYDLQIFGIAEAFRDPDVINAILSHDGVAVSVVQWSNHKQQEAGVARSLLDSAAAISTFADQVAAAPRLEVSGGTGLGAAMVYAMWSIETNRFAGDRRVIDVSGDGQNNMGVAPITIRAPAVAAGYTVNGLAILDEEPWLDRYYAKNVIGPLWRDGSQPARTWRLCQKYFQSGLSRQQRGQKCRNPALEIWRQMPTASVRTTCGF